MSAKTRSAIAWLVKNPDKTVRQAAGKFKVQPTAIYSMRKKLQNSENLPMVIPLEHSEVTAQSIVIIVKTDNPTALLRSLFQ